MRPDRKWELPLALALSAVINNKSNENCGFWIDEFIETTWLAVASRGEPLFPLFHRFISAREEKERNQNIYDVVFSSK
jgi:hypothetical protein